MTLKSAWDRLWFHTCCLQMTLSCFAKHPRKFRASFRTMSRPQEKKVDLDKTYVMFSNSIPLDRELAVVRCLDIKEVLFHDKCPSLPTYVGMEWKKPFLHLKDRIY